MGALLRLLATTGVVCAVLLLAARYLKARGVTPGVHGLAVITRYPTGKGSALLVVRAGTKLLLVGQAPGGFACLAELGDADDAEAAANAERLATGAAALTGPGTPADPSTPAGPRKPFGVMLGERLAAKLRPAPPAPTEAVTPGAAPGTETPVPVASGPGSAGTSPAAGPVAPHNGEPTAGSILDVVIGDGPVVPAPWASALSGTARAAAAADRHAVSVEQLDDEDLHRVLLEIDARTVLIAIKGAPASFAERIGNCFVGGDADRRAALVSCAVNLAGRSFTDPEIKDARRQIAAKARSLVSFGEITVRPGAGGAEFAAVLADAARTSA